MQLNLVAHFEKTGIGKMYFCKEQKKSAAFATDLLAGAEGLFLLARRSSVRTALPCQRARYSLPSYSRPSARSKEKNRLLSQPTFLAGAEGLFLLARRSSVRTALPCQRARYSLPSYSRPSARSKEKNRLLSQPTFLADPHFRNPNILPKRKNGYFSLDYRKQ